MRRVVWMSSPKCIASVYVPNTPLQWTIFATQYPNTCVIFCRHKKCLTSTRNWTANRKGLRIGWSPTRAHQRTKLTTHSNVCDLCVAVSGNARQSARTSNYAMQISHVRLRRRFVAGVSRKGHHHPPKPTRQHCARRQRLLSLEAQPPTIALHVGTIDSVTPNLRSLPLLEKQTTSNMSLRRIPIRYTPASEGVRIWQFNGGGTLHIKRQRNGLLATVEANGKSHLTVAWNWYIREDNHRKEPPSSHAIT